MTTTPEQILCLLEDTALVLKKAQINLKKCPKQRLTKGYIETRLKSIDEYWSTFKNAHYDLVKCVPKEKKQDIQYFVNEDYFIFEDLYISMQADLKDLLLLFERPEESSNVVATTKENTSGSKASPVKLPRICLPIFSGVYEEWPAFQDLFMSLVDKNSMLSNVEKLHYLKSTITGEAESLLRHIQITDSNYEQSWTMLKARFGNKRIIINSLLKRLFSQRKIPVQSVNYIKSLLDTTKECLNSLKNLKISTDSWDPLIVFLVTQKLDPETHRDWEEFAYVDDSEELPTCDNLFKFLQSKFRTLELINPPTKEKQTRPKEYAAHLSTTATNNPRTCAICQDTHTLCHCREFIKMEPAERGVYVKNNNLCFNCLAPGHSASKCRLNMFCRLCHKRHHTLIHQTSMTSTNQPDNIQAHYEEVNQEATKDAEESSKDAEESNVELQSHFTSNTSTALLATAIVLVKDEAGHSTVLRALVDIGSQASFLSERAAQALRINRTSVNGIITGVGSTNTTVKHTAELELLSRHDTSLNLKIKVYIMSTPLTKQLPSRMISSGTWPHLQGLRLADPSFDKPGRVDMLLGVDVCAQIMKSEVIKGPPGTPCAQNTSLGWILFGNVQDMNQRDEVITMHINLDLDDMLKQMWEQKTSKKKIHTADERKCEEIYESTTTRTDDGRYIVKLPTKTDTLLSTQGETRDIALSRLHQLERRLDKNFNLKEEYVKVMEEYIEMNHMQEVYTDEINNPAVYLPHHAIVREDKETTKIRAVFNASQKGNNNVSLNDELLVGPQLQDDMRSLIMRWRMKSVCYVADIQKMYRQILVTKEDRDLQRILWRSSKHEPVKDFRLMRVTFGTAAAPYLAVKTLHKVAEDEGGTHPGAARTIRNDFFMDDLMSGNDTLQDAIETAKAVESILQKGGFSLQKWCSNNAEFLKQFEEHKRSSHVNLDITLDGTVRALGLHWNMGKDLFQYSNNLPPIAKLITKRTILADIQRLFDPLGWLAPSILPTKLLIQRLWLKGITWDEEVDQTTAEEWMDLRNSFQHLSEIGVERWFYTTDNIRDNVTVHGFCDASTRAYAAVAYMRVRTSSGDVKTSIIAAKTRVAPIKPTSLPRLELSGAVLLAGLLKQIRDAMKIPTNQIFAWTDSTIVLSWLFGEPTRWNTYVSNRVVEILDSTGNQNWYHVQSKENPADVASRGDQLLELKNCEIWWNGPGWLRHGEIKYSRPKNVTTSLERKETLQINLKVQNEEENFANKFKDFDNLTELIKVISYCKRFLNGKKIEDKTRAVTTKEIEESLRTCIKIDQKDKFYDEIQSLKTNNRVRKESKLKSLQPYLDEDGILRVGGRLRHSDLNEDGKHPVILDADTYLTALVVTDAHSMTLHGGCNLMLGYLRSKFWILKAKKAVKTIVRKCLICAKQSAAARSQLMGDLPRVRVTPARPFLNSGVDFAGPYQVLMSKGRGAKTNKGYIAIFVCMCTKAIHLELVGDLTSEAFIGAFRRFVSRRGRCAQLWSDQGRNFIGANKELTQAWKESKLEFQGQIAESLALDGTQWHFIPAYSPHMGGLWEAGVKSMKHHLKRILTSSLTFEEMTTLLCQIEACLNSRPLSPIDDADIDNMEPLTPGHFLVGEAPITIPSPDLQNVPMSYLSRWQYLQKLMTDFWRRWQQEYLSRLQQRPKWQKKVVEFEIGNIVLIKSDNIPPGKWLLGRIVGKHAGADGVTRVYSVKSGDSVVNRSVCKLCPLPIDLD